LRQSSGIRIYPPTRPPIRTPRYLKNWFQSRDPQPAQLAALAHCAIGLQASPYRFDHPRSTEEYRAAVAACPTCAIANYLLGQELFFQNRFAEAKAAYVIAAKYGTGKIGRDSQNLADACAYFVKYPQTVKPAPKTGQ